MRVKPDYFEPVNLWTCCVMPPATKKTGVHLAATAPLSEWEREKRTELENEIARATSERATLEARIKHLRQKAATSSDTAASEDTQREVRKLEDELPEVPRVPQLWTADVTPENLGTIMADNDERMAVLSDEGGIFDILGGLYAGKGATAILDTFLKGHAGSPIRVNRGSRPPDFMQHPCLTIGLCPQPDVLRSLGEKRQFRGRGLLARILWALPATNVGHRTNDTAPLPEVLRLRYADNVKAILEHPNGTTPDGEPAAHVLKLSADATARWRTFWLAVERESAEGGRYAHITDWAGKLAGAVARIAALLHVARHALGTKPWEVDISGDDMQAAIRIGECLATHALAVFDEMGADEATDGARVILRWLRREHLETFTYRDCHRAHQRRFPRANDMEAAVNVLADDWYCIRAQAQTSSLAGRPSRGYTVNPALYR